MTTSKASRWFANLVIIGLTPLSARLVFPVLPAAMALLATERQWGLLNNVNLPYWLEVAMGHTDMIIGLSQFRDPQKLSLPHLLILPFVGDSGRVPINRH